jgi:hypothetical protein
MLSVEGAQESLRMNMRIKQQKKQQKGKSCTGARQPELRIVYYLNNNS